MDFVAIVIEHIYKVDLNKIGSNIINVIMLEFSQYLEHCFVPNFRNDLSTAQVLSIVSIIKGVPAKIKDNIKIPNSYSDFQRVQKFILYFLFFQMSFAFKKKANLPFNKKGRITPYTKDGGRKAHDKGGTESGLVRFKSRQSVPTMDQIQSDRLTKYANEYWAPQTLKKHLDFDANVIEDIYKVDLNTVESNIRRVMMLEFSQYLENYLWPNFSNDSSTAHVLSIVYMVNEKFRERVPAWIPFQKKSEAFGVLFKKVMDISLFDNDKISLREQTALLVFLGKTSLKLLNF